MSSQDRRRLPGQATPPATDSQPAQRSSSGPPVGNQALIEQINATSKQVDGRLGMASFGNNLIEAPVGRWAADTAGRADFMRNHMGSSMSGMPMSYGDSQREMRLFRQQAGQLRKAQGRANTAATVRGGQQALGRTLSAGGVAMSAVQGATDTGVSTTEGRVLNGVAQGGLNVLAGKAVPPPVAVADTLVSLTMKSALGENLDNGLRNTSISGTLSDSVTAVSSLTEAVRGETEGAERFHEESLRGDRGAILQGASAAGEAIQSVVSGNTADYVERAERGDYGVVAQFGNALGEGLYNVTMGDPEKAPEERNGIVPMAQRAYQGVLGWMGLGN